MIGIKKSNIAIELNQKLMKLYLLKTSFDLRIKVYSTLLVMIALLTTSCTEQSSDDGTGQDSAQQKQSGDLRLPNLPDDKPEKTDKKPKRADLGSPKNKKLSTSKNKATASGSIPDFTSYSAGPERKEQFVSFMAPIIKKENAEIKKTRQKIQQLYAAHMLGKTIPQEKIQWLEDLAKKYRVKKMDFPSEEAFRALLIHVDIIPVELALAQAANESAWGTSYFAQKGNNIFGKWCFRRGCGLVPRRRSEGSNHEVKVYSSVAGSVKDYLHHLNSHPAYRQLRVLRYEQREKGQKPEGSYIALGLKKYSAIGMDYVNILRSMIKNNQELMKKT